MQLSHRIRLNATSAQVDYFARAAGTARRVWNWALAEWKRQAANHMKPNAMALKKQFNAIKYSDSEWLDPDGNPWLRSVHRDAHAQPFKHLDLAWRRYFEQRRAGLAAYRPVFKKKGRCRDSFYVANDRFRITGKSVTLPRIGAVGLSEELRLHGKITGATITREADHWFLAIQVDVPDAKARLRRSGDGIVGVDLGLTAAASLSNGEKVFAPRPLNAALRRLRIRARRQSRKLEMAKLNVGIDSHTLNGTRLPVSKNRKKAADTLARLHARITRVRKDFLHKLTTRICRENQAVAIENLHIKGMLSNARLARSIADVGFYEFRRQLVYKARRYGTHIVVADRWYPSSRLCSHCGVKNKTLKLSDRSWTCSCGAHHDRDINAAINLQRLATAFLGRATALPVASLAATPALPPG